MHNREGLTLKRLWKACCDYDLWPLYIMYVHHIPVYLLRRGLFSTDHECKPRGFAFGIPVGPPTSYLTLSLRNLGYVPSTFYPPGQNLYRHQIHELSSPQIRHIHEQSPHYSIRDHRPRNSNHHRHHLRESQRSLHSRYGHGPLGPTVPRSAVLAARGCQSLDDLRTSPCSSPRENTDMECHCPASDDGYAIISVRAPDTSGVVLEKLGGCSE